MVTDERLGEIVGLVEERGFISVKELSNLCDVSEMTIRRDLQRLDEDKRIRRTYGGAMSIRPAVPAQNGTIQSQVSLQPAGSLVDRVDVLVTSSVDPEYDRILLDRVEKRNIPIVAESLSVGREATVVSIDNHLAGVDLGQWAGKYAQEHWGGQAFALDLSYYLSNTQARSEGFIAGLKEILPLAQVVLSINAQSRYETAYQLTLDALTVHPNINVIFAINDATAWGAINACCDLGRDPDSVLVFTIGLEGNTLKNALLDNKYCKAAATMFPEIVGPVCVEAAIMAYNHQSLPRQLLTPHVLVTRETLLELYDRTETSWEIKWDVVSRRLSIPLDISRTTRISKESYPRRLGFIVPFGGHEWYKNLTTCMRAHAESLKIEFEIVDAEHTLKGEMDLRRRGIAQLAAQQVQPGDVILIDSGQMTTYLAEELIHTEKITVITNSIAVFDLLKDNAGITLISTGGLLRRTTDTFVGSTAETALRELRADKLFLVVAGITLGFGLSHTHLGEVAVKQAMLRAAREVFLLADHTVFGQDSMVQVAPVKVVHRLITDEALPASIRLELTKLGIEVLVART